MLLSEVRDWLKTFEVADSYYVGKMDSKPDKALGIYQRQNSYAPIVALGGLSTYKIKPVSLLLHWTKNATETERQANNLYEKLRTQKNIKIGDTQVYFVNLLQSEPIDVHTDDNGVYERVIEFDIYFERND